jgi:hypothetical protein
VRGRIPVAAPFPSPAGLTAVGLSPQAGRGGEKIRPLMVVFGLFALLVGGCSMSKWTVKPHQRELLADRIMQLDADAQERSAEEHVLANREGAIGGTGTSGGGCGCN